MLPNLSLQLHNHSSLDLLKVSWHDDSVASSLHDQYEMVLAAEPARQTQRWLLDVRRHPTPTIETANWVTYNWLPRAAAILAPLRLRIAYVISLLRPEALESDPNLQDNLQHALTPNRHYDIRLFGDEAEAVRWLTE